MKSFLAFSVLVISTYGATFTAKIDISNVTNPSISKLIYGTNIYQADYASNENYFGNYTLGRLGGNAQTRYQYDVDGKCYTNKGKDWYFISSEEAKTWRQYYDVAISDGLALWTQIPAMGWIAAVPGKSFSFNTAKYGNQTSNECSNFPAGTTWCSKFAGNGIRLNGSYVDNDPFDANIESNPEYSANFTKAVVSAYPEQAIIFSIDNEPTLWSDTHRDVHPEGSTYDEIVNATLNYGAAIKSACNESCMIAGYSPWGWCGYFEDGYDHDLPQSFCKGGGPHYIAKNNMSLTAYYLEKLAEYEEENGQRLLDIMDIHYYPSDANIWQTCDETDNMASNRLQAPRCLYDWSYNDSSWIKESVALIPRYKNWINKYYPNTKLSISEFSFGGDNCITSTIAHCEVLAIFATYDVYAAMRWSKPRIGSQVITAWKIFTNYDGNGGNVHNNGDSYAVNVINSNIEKVTSYSFIYANNRKMFVVAYNKENNENMVQVMLINNTKGLQINGMIHVYGIDDNQGLRFIASINSSHYTSFNMVLAPLSIRLAVIPTIETITTTTINTTQYYEASTTVQTSQQSQTGDNGQAKESGLSGGAVAGIVIAVILVLIVIAVLIWYFVFKPKTEYNQTATTKEKVQVEINDMKKMKSDSADSNHSISKDDRDAAAGTTTTDDQTELIKNTQNGDKQQADDGNTGGGDGGDHGDND